MSSPNEIREALRKAAEAVTGEPVTDPGADQLYRYYNAADGDTPSRAFQALHKMTRFSTVALRRTPAAAIIRQLD